MMIRWWRVIQVQNPYDTGNHRVIALGPPRYNIYNASCFWFKWKNLRYWNKDHAGRWDFHPPWDRTS